MKDAEWVHLETKRLRLRRFTSADVDLIVDLDSDPEVTRYTNGGRPTTREDVECVHLPRVLAFYNEGENLGYWAAVEKPSSRFIGWFHFRPHPSDPWEIELGYRPKREAWGKGYATEGSLALLERGFRELGIAKIVADALLANRRSTRVMEKLGMSLESEFVCGPDEFPGFGFEERRGVKYAITREEWEQRTRDLELQV